MIVCFFTASVLAMSDETEVAIGRGVDARLRKEYGVFQNPDLQRYIEHVGLKLVNVSGRQNIVYHFTVLDSDTINAIAVCGGYVYITKGLLTRMETEAQLAAALAHQIVHIARRHGAKETETAMESDADMIAALMPSKKPMRKTDLLLYGINSAYRFVETGYGKKLETEADIKGIECLLRAGYDPEAMLGMLNIFQVEEKKQPESMFDLLRAHRKTTKRIDAVRLMAESLMAENPNKYDSTKENRYEDRYKKNVLDVFGVKEIE